MEKENAKMQSLSYLQTQKSWQSTRCNSTTTKKDMLFEECKTMKPELLLGVIPTVPTLPLSRSLRIELDS
eukprot:3974773-Prorocentrum_lima.AAC.1